MDVAERAFYSIRFDEMYAHLSQEVKEQRARVTAHSAGSRAGSLSLRLPPTNSPQFWLEPLLKMASSLSIVSGKGESPAGPVLPPRPHDL